MVVIKYDKFELLFCLLIFRGMGYEGVVKLRSKVKWIKVMEVFIEFNCLD